jgi:predicted RNA-binding Zn-ribbon protein involved in translation (DUF1610 family)
MSDANHTATAEIIWHFSCGNCGNWWSYATMETGWRPQRMTCPHCGHASGTVICETVPEKQ